ncbi:MAG TPA: histidine phosphatase family protein, partial [Candidatus Angelobacter sp.]|nr:histidine phosphatase family protein [Candidatus Angelobacter sp.]
MSRRLVVLRHAKSSWPPGVPDHDRPLGPRGVVDARAAGAWIRDHVDRLDHVVVSSARRARGTWTLAAAVIGPGDVLIAVGTEEQIDDLRRQAGER